MLKFNALAGLIILVGAVLFAFVGVTNAHTFRTGTNVTLGQGETVNDTVFLSGRNIDISSEVNGDVFCAGQTISVSGTIHGDVICAGQTINITGEVDGDIRLAAQTITISGKITDNATLATQSLNLTSSGTVEGDISIASSDATINGPVGRNLAAASESLIIANSVGGNITGNVNSLSLTSSANVSGNISYTSSTDLTQADGAVVGGEITRSEPTKDDGPKLNWYYGFNFFWFLYWLLAFLMIALVLTLLFPRMFHTVTDRAFPRPWKPLLIGFGAGFVVPVITFVLAITFVGLPMAFLVGLTWFLILLLSAPVFSYYIGRLILRGSTRPVLIMLVGAAVFLVALFIPIIGFLAFLGAAWIGTGMLLLELFDRTPRPVYSLEGEANRHKA